MKGSCLCGLTLFNLNVLRIKAYQCHCSLCRKQSGTSSNLGAIVSMESFEWLTSNENVKRWKKDSGFTADFCSNCGSPVPNKLRDMNFYWVPVGALEEGSLVEINVHLCTDSKAVWDEIPVGAVEYKSLPDISSFVNELVSE